MRKVWKKIVMLAVIILLASGLSVQFYHDQSAKATEQDGFVIEDGVLIKYNGSASEVWIPEGVKEIGDLAFSYYETVDDRFVYGNRTITKIVIPDGVVSIGDMAFFGLEALETLEIPSSVVEFGEEAFGVSREVRGDEGPIYLKTKWLENKVKESPLVVVNDVLVDAMAAEGKVVVPVGVKKIADRAFFAFFEDGAQDNVTEIVLPDTLTDIGYGAFENLRNLKAINIPGGVRHIRHFTFAGCKSLKRVVLPDTVTDIAFEAFSNCHSLEELWVPSSVTYLGGRYDFCTWCPQVVIYCEEGSYVHRYVRSYQQYKKTKEFFDQELVAPYDYVLVKEEKEDPEIVTLTADHTVISRDEMAALAELNQTRDIVIQTSDGVRFTFSKGKLDLSEEVESYDFGVTLIEDYEQCTLQEQLTEENFVFEIHYNYSGQLPGWAKVSIPVNEKYVDSFLSYYKFQEDGTRTWLQTSLVDENGYYTISMDHCSDYIAELSGAPSEPDVTEENEPQGTVSSWPSYEPGETEEPTGTTSPEQTTMPPEQTTTPPVQTTTPPTPTNSDQPAGNTPVPQETPTGPGQDQKDTSKDSDSTAPAKVKIKKLQTVKGKKLKVTWKPVSEAEGYQVQIALNKKFTKGKKSLNQKSKSTTTISKLKKGKRYYVRVRAYKTVDGKKVYGAWSTIKQSKTVK